MSSSIWNLFGFLSKVSAPNLSRRGALFATSTAGLVVIMITAVYLRRKRKPLLVINPTEDKNGNVVACKNTKRKKRHSRSKRDLMSPTEPRFNHRMRHHRDNSVMSESSTVSSVRSSTSRRSRRIHLPPIGDKEYFEAEKLYRSGVDAFEAAMTQWEKAGNALYSDLSDVSPSLSGRNSSLSHEGARGQLPFSSESGSFRGRRTPASRSRKSSSSQKCQSLPDHPQNQERGDSLTQEETDGARLNSSSASEIEQKLTIFMERAERLQRSFEDVLYTDSETESDTDITLTGYDDPRLSDVDSDTTSFVSAQEVWETLSLEEYQSQQHLALYENALEAVDRGQVKCRTLRTDMLDCFSDIEFLAKLHCIRQAFEVMLQDTPIRAWFMDSGRKIIELLLKSANHDRSRFIDAFTRLTDYISSPDNWFQIEEELKGRKVVSMSFYDIVLDFIIMDSFDDLERPPSSVLSVLSNRWLANSIKETALSTAVWSVLRAKSGLLRYPDGFIAKFYAVSESISPVLAWGFLGPDEGLKSNCMKFKDEVLAFLRGIFSFEQVRYTTVKHLSEDILRLARLRMQKMTSYFEMQKS